MIDLSVRSYLALTNEAVNLTGKTLELDDAGHVNIKPYSCERDKHLHTTRQKVLERAVEVIHMCSTKSELNELRNRVKLIDHSIFEPHNQNLRLWDRLRSDDYPPNEIKLLGDQDGLVEYWIEKRIETLGL